MKYYPIDEETARISHQMMSLTDYREGSTTAAYRAAVDEAAALVDRRKQKVSPFYHEKLDALLDCYTQRLAEWTNAHNRNGASCPSVLVCGAGNFPTRKKHKQNARENTLQKEYQEIQGVLDKIKSVGTGPIDLTDPHARELLTERVQAYQAELDRGKAINAHYRKHKTLKGFPGLTDKSAAELDQCIAEAPPFARTPCPDFHLTSLRNKIKTAKKRLEGLDKLEAQRIDPAALTISPVTISVPPSNRMDSAGPRATRRGSVSLPATLNTMQRKSSGFDCGGRERTSRRCVEVRKRFLFLLAAALFVAAVVVSIVYVKAVLESDLPSWLKFILI